MSADGTDGRDVQQQEGEATLCTPDLSQLIAAAEHLSPEHHPAQAVALNQQILSLDPQNAAAYVRLARAYQSQRQFAAAEAACREALQRNPQSTVAQKRLQRIQEEWALAKRAQSITTFHEALRQGVEQKEQEQAGYAIACLWRAVELSANRAHSIQSRTALGAAYRARKDSLSLERAAAQYELVLQHAPDNLAAMTGLAAVLRDKGELSQAKALYERVLAVAPQDTHALNGLAGVLHDLGDAEGAELRFRHGRQSQRTSH
jgi:tetratricopeptide (TPR) repeat protein